MIAMSTTSSAKYLNAMAVSNSKKVGALRCLTAAAETCRMSLVKSVLPMGRPLIVIRSRMSMRCGLV